MKKTISIFAGVIITLLSLLSCSPKEKRFIIGVSQCSEDLWRETVNNEILREASFRSNLDVIIRSVKDDSRQQIKDIEQFIADKVDLIVVSPNEANELTPVVSKAFTAGIPVILLDRKIVNENYTAYIGADNYRLAYLLGVYAAGAINYKGHIAEIRGLKGSTADEERHRGFRDALASYPEIEVIAEDYGNFLRETATEKMLTIINSRPDRKIDLVFAMNDQMAVGVNDAFKMSNSIHRPFIIGIDAVVGEGGGIDYVDKGVIDASFIYPTGGDIAIDVANKILNGQKFERENILTTGVVDKSNVRVISLQNRQIIAQQEYAVFLDAKLNNNLMLYSRQKQFSYLSLIFSVIAILFLMVLIRINNSKNKLNQKLNTQNEEIKKQLDILTRQKVQLEKLSQELEIATHAKLVFFTDISHEFKTPLTLIQGTIEELLSSDNLNKPDKESLQIIQRNSYRLIGLLNQILEFRSFENGKMKINYTVQRLDTFLENINELFSRFIYYKKIHFQYDTDGNNYLLPFDGQKMEKIYFNLLSNAFKHVLPNGQIRVHLKQTVIDHKPYYVLSVYNSDSYIPKDKIRSIFERFYQIDAKHNGSGIGLALTKPLVEIHGGTITVESDVDKGTTFIVSIPITDIATLENEIRVEEQTISEETKNQISSIAIPALIKEEVPIESVFDSTEIKDNPTVLLIEDNPEMTDYVLRILERDYNTVSAADGEEGIRKALKHIPDIILCDVMMPGIDGFDVCRTLKSNAITAHIPIIILTACGLDEQKIEGFESGADAYISKPFNSEILKIRINKLIRNKENIQKHAGSEWLIGNEYKTLADDHKEFIDNLKTYVETHIQEEISVEDLACSLRLSKPKFYRKLKEITTYSPTQLINHIKLKRAAYLMLYERKTISEAAFASGFSSPSYFTKIFYKYYQQLPSEYIRQQQPAGNIAIKQTSQRI